MPQTTLDQEAQQIIATYTFLYKVIFKFGTFVLLGVLSIVFSFLLLADGFGGAQYQAQKNEQDVVLRKITLVQTQDKADEMFDVQLIGGNFSYSGDVLSSYHNLTVFKGWVLPRFSEIHANLLPWVRDFSGGSASSGSLDLVMRMLLGSGNFAQAPFRIEQIDLPNPESLFESFNIYCLKGWKIIGYVCDTYVSTFLSEMFVYRLSDRVDELREIMELFSSQPSQQQKLCQNIVKKSLFEPQPQIYREVMDLCPENYQKEYERVVDFLEIQNQLNQTPFPLITPKYYAQYPELNAYKLLSLQQILFGDVLQKKIDVVRMNGYFQYLQDLLKASRLSDVPLLDQIYWDLALWYNNMVLSPALKNIDARTLPQGQEGVNGLLDQIKRLNAGDENLDIPSLAKFVSPSPFFQEFFASGAFAILQSGSLASSLLSEDVLLRDYLYSPAFVSQTPQRDGSTALVKGVFVIASAGSQVSLPATLTLSVSNNKVQLLSVVFDKLESINQALVPLVQAGKIQTLQDVVQTIINNPDFAKQSVSQNQRSLCDILQYSQYEKLIVSCTGSTLVMMDPDLVASLKITFVFSGANIRSLSIPDPSYQQQLNTLLPQLQNQSLTSLDIINRVLETIKPVSMANTGPVLSLEQIKISDTFTKFFGLQPTRIAPRAQKGKYSLDFSVQSLQFVAQYDAAYSRIDGFIIKGQVPVLVKYSLELTDANLQEIRRFVLDPLAELAKKDRASVEDYKKKNGVFDF